MWNGLLRSQLMKVERMPWCFAYVGSQRDMEMTMRNSVGYSAPAAALLTTTPGPCSYDGQKAVSFLPRLIKLTAVLTHKSTHGSLVTEEPEHVGKCTGKDAGDHCQDKEVAMYRKAPAGRNSTLPRQISLQDVGVA